MSQISWTIVFSDNTGNGNTSINVNSGEISNLRLSPNLDSNQPKAYNEY